MQGDQDSLLSELKTEALICISMVINLSTIQQFKDQFFEKVTKGKILQCFSIGLENKNASMKMVGEILEAL